MSVSTGAHEAQPTLFDPPIISRRPQCDVDLTPVPSRRLPVRELRWLPERCRDVCPDRPLKVGDKGYRKGCDPGNKGIVYRPQPLTESEALALIAQAPRDLVTGIRDRALFAVLWRTGMRINCEALRLVPHDLDRDRGTIEIRCGKGGKYRVVAMDPYGWDVLEEWMQVRPDFPAGPIFCVTTGPNAGTRAIYAQHFRVQLQKWRAAAEITKRVHPHGMRHSLTCDLIREAVPLPIVQAQLGHASLATTSIYASGMGEERIAVIGARTTPGSAT